MLKGSGKKSKKGQQLPTVLQPVLVEDIWVECDNPDCKKWRKLPPGSNPPPDGVEWCDRVAAQRAVGASSPPLLHC